MYIYNQFISIPSPSNNPKIYFVIKNWDVDVGRVKSIEKTHQKHLLIDNLLSKKKQQKIREKKKLFI